MTIVGVVILTSVVLSLLNTLSLLFFTVFNDRVKKFSALTVSSGFTTISLVLLYFDIDAIASNRTNLIATFFTFLSLAIALVILVKALIMILDKKEFLPLSVWITYSVLGASLITLATYLDMGIFRTISYYLIIVFPFSILIFKYLITYKYSKKSIVFYQASAILVIAFIGFIYLLIYRLTNPLADFPPIEVLNSVLIAVIQISMYFSVVLEVIASDAKALDDKNLLLELSNQKIKKASETDPLTELYNRRKMNEIIEFYYEKSLNSESTFSVLIMDCDDFKSINDIFGHNEGDNVLKYISKSLKHALRDCDFIGRWGGDEFFVLLPDLCELDFAKIEESIDEYFDKYPYKNPKINISLSLGIAEFKKDLSLNELINNADTMMYLNKASRKQALKNSIDVIN